jgi:CheY-like chemotaxis protein
MSGSGMHLFLVDDNAADAKLAARWLRESPAIDRVDVVHDGERALQWLRRNGCYADAPRPDLILLDVNLPRMTGFELLAEIRADSDLAGIPVIVLSASNAEADVSRAIALGADRYFAKPSDAGEFAELVSAVEGFRQGGSCKTPQQESSFVQRRSLDSPS